MFNASIRTTPQGWNILLPTTGYTVSVQTTKDGLHVTGTRSNGRNGHAITTRAERKPNLLREIKRASQPARSAKMIHARRNQGLYLNALRPLSKANRNRIRKVREEKGVTTAIREARKLTS